eukprot:GHVS01035523.1.p1 GENE.GHVS01035523.1~~GHVS01035523.1.p1  ORF type:complete len:472 (+),score=131.69 GHVS01035523.1:286-1701(+)
MYAYTHMNTAVYAAIFCLCMNVYVLFMQPMMFPPLTTTTTTATPPNRLNCHLSSSSLVDSTPTAFSAFTDSLLGVAAGMWLTDADYVGLPPPKDSTLRQRRHHLGSPMMDLSRWIKLLVPHITPAAAIVLDIEQQVGTRSTLEGEVLGFVGGGSFGSVVQVRNGGADFAVKICHGREEEAVEELAGEFLSHLRVRNSPHVVQALGAMLAPQRELAAYIICVMYVLDVGETELEAAVQAVDASAHGGRARLLGKAAERFGCELVQSTLEYPFCMLVTHMCHQGSLSDVMDDDAATLEGRRRMVAQLSCGVRDLHRAGLVHRDLKEANAFVTSAGRVVVGDLGSARHMAAPHTSARKRVRAALQGQAERPAKRRRPHEVEGATGTRPYSAPEMLGDRQRVMYNEACDIWSLGVVAAHLFARAETNADLLFGREGGGWCEDNGEQQSVIFEGCEVDRRGEGGGGYEGSDLIRDQ